MQQGLDQKSRTSNQQALTGSKCFCMDSPLPRVKKSDGDCRIKCSGNKKEFCGGKTMISIHKNPFYEKDYLGCFRSMYDGRNFVSHQKMNAEVCRKLCEKQNAKYYGLQHGIKCSCGDRTPQNRHREEDCGSMCRGSDNEYCGGQHTQSIYENRKHDNGYLGCFYDQSSLTSNVKSTSSKSMTVYMCREFCQKEDVPFYSLQAGNKCFCRTSPLPDVKKSDGECRIKCNGNEKEFCGGKTVIAIHKNSFYERGYLGCFRAMYSGRTLVSHQKMNAEVCRKFCIKHNTKYYGLQHGIQCHCGDRIPTNRHREEDCGHMCRGSDNEYCGGHHTQSIYLNRKDDTECVNTADGRDYEGKLNKTRSGRICQYWASQYPHRHGFTYLPDNYCRNPDGEPGVWCYTTDPKKRWELCGVPKCAKKKGVAKECVKTADGRGYKGKWNKTRSLRTCQSWSSRSPHKHRFTSLPNNYCRNPDGEPGVWCYTTDPKKRWELCGLPICNGN